MANISTELSDTANATITALFVQDVTNQHSNDLLDHALMDTFPASDPVSSNIFE